MTRPTWTEITSRAHEFAARWAGETHERSESQTFWTEFLAIFGVDRRRAGGYFEYAVRLRSQGRGFVDLFLPGRLLVEQKSGGSDLGSATTQALAYLDALPDSDLPKGIVVSNFEQFQYLNLETTELTSFRLADLARNVRLFGALLDERSEDYQEQGPVNRRAAERMAALHNRLAVSGYRGHALELFLVRVVFCLFADDSQIFAAHSFERLVRERSALDGSDLGALLGKIFETLATDPSGRSSLLDPSLAELPYVNGGLFSERIAMPDFDASARMALIQACTMDWSGVSPAIFGAMFQGVLDEGARRDLGAHYTSEENILRAIKPLFLDDLYTEFEEVKRDPRLRLAFHDRLATLKILDPACGCGNFLAVAYREIRRLEHRLVELIVDQTSLIDVTELLRVRVEQFAGIELEEFPALVAKTSMWLADHQMNIEASERLGVYYTRLPLQEGANIVQADALDIDWETVVPAEDLDYIVGNPPFIGSHMMSPAQKSQLKRAAGNLRQSGFLDYVSAWYFLAARMMSAHPQIKSAFVSTNSIAQGEQPAILWPGLLDDGFKINFAHQTFRWSNSARDVASVHCVIVGFSKVDEAPELYEYPEITGEPVLNLVEEISPYLQPGTSYVVGNREHQISDEPPMAFGNMPADGGFLLLTAQERDALVAADPRSERWILPCFGAREFIQRTPRYCLWLEDATPGQIRSVPEIARRVGEVRRVRLSSARPKLAEEAHLFAQRTQSPLRPFLLIPGASSEARDYVPMGFFGPGNIATNACLVVADADAYVFGVLTSRMHMDWLRLVGGRLKSDYRYSKEVVYNNFVFPETSAEDRALVMSLANDVLARRDEYPDSSLADLYDRRTMPSSLARAHRALDEVVEKLYLPGGFSTPEERTNHLLALHRERAANGLSR